MKQKRRRTISGNPSGPTFSKPSVCAASVVRTKGFVWPHPAGYLLRRYLGETNTDSRGTRTIHLRVRHCTVCAGGSHENQPLPFYSKTNVLTSCFQTFPAGPRTDGRTDRRRAGGRAGENNLPPGSPSSINTGEASSNTESPNDNKLSNTFQRMLIHVCFTVWCGLFTVGGWKAPDSAELFGPPGGGGGGGSACRVGPTGRRLIDIRQAVVPL